MPAEPTRSGRPWRARAFHLTRNRHFLIKGVSIILISFALLAAATDSLRHLFESPDDPASEETEAVTIEERFPGSTRTLQQRHDQSEEELKRLRNSPKPNPERLAEWIRSTATMLSMVDEKLRSPFDPETFKLGTEELEPVFKKHAPEGPVYEAFTSYARCRFASNAPQVREWRAVLIKGATSNPPVRYAGEFQGDLLLLEGKMQEALTAYAKDAFHEDSIHARRMALELALNQNNSEVLDLFVQEVTQLNMLTTPELIKISQLLNDKRLVVRAIYSIQTERWLQYFALPVALLTGAIWYIILVHTASRERWRWWRYLPAVVLGMLSVLLLHWFQITLDYPSHPEAESNATQQMMHWIMYVGVPEEACKLVLFAFFLPVLLHVKSARKAALTAGCVGLGFALNENLSYFINHGTQVAIGRLVTANFIHISLTGIVGYYLYDLFRSKFHTAQNFVLAFIGVCVAHGLYDFALGTFGLKWEINIASIVIVAAAAKFYFQPLHQDDRADHARGGSGTLSSSGGLQLPISRTCVFWFGASALTGILMVAAVWETRDLGQIAETLKQAISLVPVAFIYMREFDEVNG